MAYRESVFGSSAPGSKWMARSFGLILIVLMLSFTAYQFLSGYLHARFGKASERSALIGEWVGVAQLQPLEGTHQPPSYEHGSGTIKLYF